MPDILILDDDITTLKLLSRLMKNDGYKVQEVSTIEACRAALEEGTFKVLFADHSGAFATTLEWIEDIRQAYPALPVILGVPRDVLAEKKLTSNARTITYLEKPFRLDLLMPTILKVFDAEEQAEVQATTASPVQINLVRQFAGLTAQSEAMQKVVSLLERIAPLDVPILIYGEKGTEKDMLAMAVHQRSRRKERKLISFACDSCPAGELEQAIFGVDGSAKKNGLLKEADGSSLFLDEISVLTVELQKKLVASLAQKNLANVRLIAGACHGPRELLAKGMDSTLHHTLSVVAIPLKPLRERREDILPLAAEILRNNADANQAPPEMDADAASAIHDYNWPGNVPELTRVLNHAAQEALKRQQKITRALLPEAIQQAAGQ